MLLISIENRPTDILVRFDGHAGHAGEDDVCAMASVLFYTAVNWLDRSNYLLGYEDSSCSRSRWLRAQCGQKPVAVVEAMMTGLQMLAESYPQNVQVLRKAETV